MDISDWREKIDKVDREILTLLNTRTDYVLELVPLKRRDAVPVYEPKREAEVFANVQKHNHGPLDEKAVQTIFRCIIEVMRVIQTTPQQKNGARIDAPVRPASPGRGVGTNTP